MSIGTTYSQAEVQALRGKCEQLADDVRGLSTVIHTLRTALVVAGGGHTTSARPSNVLTV